MKTFFIAFICIGTFAFGQDYVKINNRLNEIYKEQNVTPGSRISDERYVRRAYLQIAGRIPTAEEFDVFIASPDKNKRHNLVDKLLNSEDYVSHWYNYWADILRTEDRFRVNFMSGEPYIEWIKQSIRENKPYDIFVKDILTASGTIYENPATGYFWKDRGMPLDNLAGTSEIFFGTDISCAQCHNDPFTDWTQLDYYRFAAFFAQNQEFAGTKEERENVEKIRKYIIALREKNEASTTATPESDNAIDEDERAKKLIARGSENSITQILRASTSAIVTEESKNIKLPHDYKYDDAAPNDVVEPAFLFGQSDITNKENYRIDFAEWGISKDNPYFTRNIVNRYWGQIFGAPIIYPIESISVTSNIRDEKLVDILEDIFKEQNYDIKKFLATLYKTNLFERNNFVDTDLTNYMFQGPALQRMSAEQIWDSILVLAVEDVNYFKSDFAEQYKSLMDIDVANITAEDALGIVEQYNELRRVKYKDIKTLQGVQLIRASEVTIPTNTTNILRELGQSERILIQDSTRDGSVTQSLVFTNGPISKIITDKQSTFFKKIEEEQDHIEYAFKAILQRRPTMQEKDLLKLASKEDIVWSIINMHEFKFY